MKNPNMQLNYLQVKIENLGDEARTIKSKEKEALDTARAMRIRNRLTTGNFTDAQMDRLAKKALRTRPKVAGFAADPKGEHIQLSPSTTNRGPADLMVLARPLQKNKITPADPAWIDYQMELYGNLRSHRKNQVRSEARWSHLAYGFLRGKSYASMEQLPYKKRTHNHHDQKFSKVDWDAVKRIVLAFSEKKEHNKILSDLAVWAIIATGEKVYEEEVDLVNEASKLVDKAAGVVGSALNNLLKKVS